MPAHGGMHAALSMSIFLTCAQGESPFSLSTLASHYIVKVCVSLRLSYGPRSFAIAVDRCTADPDLCRGCSSSEMQVAAGRCQDAEVSFGLLDGARTSAQFDKPTAAVVAGVFPYDTVLVADKRNARIRRVAADAVSTIAGSTFGYADASSASGQRFRNPSDVSASPDGKWAAVLDEGNAKVRRLDLLSCFSSTIAGAGVGFTDGSAQLAKFSSPQGLAVSPDGEWIAVADTGNSAIRRINIATGITSTLVGIETCTLASQTGTCERTGSNRDGFVDGFTPQKLRTVVALVCSTSATSVAADQVESVSSDSDPTSTRLSLTVVHAGKIRTDIETERQNFLQKAQLFAADIAAHLSIGPTRVAIECPVAPCHDTAQCGQAPSCTGSPPMLAVGNATSLRFVVSGMPPSLLKRPTRLTFSTDGTLLIISDTGNNAIRKLDLAAMTLSTVAGNGMAGTQDGHSSNAVLTAPAGVAISADTRIVLVAEPSSHSIRRIDLHTGTIGTLAGNGTASAINGQAQMSTFRSPSDVSFGPGDAWVVVADTGNNCLRNLTTLDPEPQATPILYSKTLLISAACRRVGVGEGHGDGCYGGIGLMMNVVVSLAVLVMCRI